jgi:hypothetical protein
LQSRHNTLSDYNQIINHNSQHQNQSKRNDVIETISYRFEINKVCQIYYEKRKENNERRSCSQKQKNDKKHQQSGLPKIANKESVCFIDTLFL